MRGDDPSCVRSRAASHEQFAACAGIIRLDLDLHRDSAHRELPACAGRSGHPSSDKFASWEFPACAGMIRRHRLRET